MKWSNYSKTHDGAIVDNRMQRTINLVLVAVVAMMAYALLARDQIVVVQPETLGSEAWITTEDASQSYKESWGLYLAQLTGNITPGNVDFLKDRLKPLLAPSIYNEVIDLVEIQAQSIKDDRISYRFEPREVAFEEKTNKVFVYGYSFVKGADNKEERQERTYEYRIEIEQYAPLIVDLNTYADKPRTQDVLARMAAKEARG